MSTLFLLPGKPAEFTVFCKGAGVKKPTVQCKVVNEDTGEEVDCKIKDNMDGSFKVIYYPKAPGKYVVNIHFMDEPIPKSPVSVTIKPFCDPGKVKASGPGLTGKLVLLNCQFVESVVLVNKLLSHESEYQ